MCFIAWSVGVAAESNRLTALRTISMRIRGFDEETGEIIEDVETLTGDIADLTKTANNPMGVSLFTDETRTEYKGIYEILRDIHGVYNDLTDKQQAGLLEKLGGKRGGQVIAAILGNFDAVEKSMQTMQDSAGNALKEMSIIEESVEFRLNRLKETATGIFQNVGSSDTMKSIVDFATGFLGVIDTLSGAIGGIPVLVAGLSAAFSAKNIGRDKNAFPYSRDMPIAITVLSGYGEFRLCGS